MSGELAVGALVDAIKHQVHQIESAQQRWRQVNVLRYRQVWVVFRADRVGRSKNTRPGIERSDDTRFCDGDSLLLHHFVQDRTSRVGHLVEFVDTADTAIAEDESTRFEH